jgi:catechol 2,3-dioxygenase
MTIDPDLRIDSVRLAVGELERSADFYERVLGLPVLSRSEEEVSLGAEEGRASLILSAIAEPTHAPARSTGLFHVAWLHPTRAALADTVRRIVQARWRLDGASDHGVSEALYLSDPDGLGIEIYVDRPRERWARPPGGQGVEMVTLALDIDDLLAQAPQTPVPRIAPGTFVGHVHMKVSDVARANDFYRDALGFEEQARLPSAAFLSAGGYHHHIGLNSWQSQGSPRPPDSAPGLREVGFRLGGAGAIDALAEQATGSESLSRDESARLSIRDPDGQLLSFTA